MSSARYVPLSTDHLAANPSGEVTMQTLLEDSERLAEEARDIMPYDFGECSYSKGYLRQAVWSCLGRSSCWSQLYSSHKPEMEADARRLRGKGRLLRLLHLVSRRHVSPLRPAGHRPLTPCADHKLVELFVRRQFRCDCPTLPAPSSTSERACKLNPPALQPAPPNEENKYDSNFRNEFCRCGRAYDPETEAEAMLQCMGCEVRLSAQACGCCCADGSGLVPRELSQSARGAASANTSPPSGNGRRDGGRRGR